MATRHQLLLGDDKFIEAHQAPQKQEALREVSIAQRRSQALPLQTYQGRHADRWQR